MKTLALVVLLSSLPALATDFRYVGTLVASSGASTNNNAAANIKSDGTTGAIGSLGGSATVPYKLAMQCDVAVRVKTGSVNTVAAANTGANKGIKVDVEQLFYVDLTAGYIAIIPASGSGSANCDLYRRLP